MTHKGLWLGGVALMAIAAARIVYWQFNNLVAPVAMAANYFKFMGAPKGTLTIETAPDAPPLQEARASAASSGDADWPRSGLTEVLWPTEITTAKVSILGLAPKS